MKTRLAVAALCLATALVAPCLRAQAPSSRSASVPVVPSTPAGTVLRSWLDVFNRGDSTRIGAYFRSGETTPLGGVGLG